MFNRAVLIDVGKGEFWIEEIDREDVFGPIDWGLYCHLERFKSYSAPIDDGSNALCFGMGKLAWSELSGTRRMVLTFRSPLWGGFFLSSMGGASYIFRHVGVDFITIVGKSPEPAVLLLKGLRNGKVEVRFELISLDNLISIFNGLEGRIGFPSLAYFVARQFGRWYEGSPFAVAAVGPAALNTNLGAVAAFAFKGGRADGPASFSARGAPGSAMFKAHKVVAVAFGGNYIRAPKFVKADLSKPNVLDNLFNTLAGGKHTKVVFDATVKYRFDPTTGSGGTFGNNYAYYDGLNPSFNWSYIYWGSEERRIFFEKVISKHFVEPFNREVIAKKSWRSCLEPCLAVCRKMYKDKEHKIDYETYCSCGANVGILDFHMAHEAARLVDAMGFDAIEFGNTAAWIFELLHSGMLKPDELGLSQSPRFDHQPFYDDVINNSGANLEIMKAITRKVAYGEEGLARIIGLGIRRAAKQFDKLFTERIHRARFEDLAAYVPMGEDGSMTPAMYWGPGNYMPMPIVGKYLTQYGGTFADPEELAKQAIDRAIKELYSENMGMCRFHRGWSEKHVPRLIEEAYGVSLNFDEHNKQLIRRIVDYDNKAGYTPRFWESGRVLDMLTYAAKEFGRVDWYEKLKSGGAGAAREYWQKFLAAFENLLDTKWLMLA